MSRWRSDWNRLIEADPELLGVAELEDLATAAFMLGRYGESVEYWDRAHSRHVDEGDAASACRSLFWLMLAIGEDDVGSASRIGGQLARIERLVEEHGLGELERSYLQCYAAIDAFMSGQLEEGIALWAGIAETGRAHADPDVWVFGAQGYARSLLRLARAREGAALLDEIFVSMTSGVLSPMMTGWVYCSCLAGCYEAFDLPRAIEWTRSATDWADGQQDLQTYTGVCLLFRARVRRLLGSLTEALEDVERACSQLERGRIHHALGEAHYERAEILRLQGDHVGAEEGYRAASRFGQDPQPGLALLRVAQGKALAASSALRRALDEAPDATRRAELLPAYGEVALAHADVDAAEGACQELDSLAEIYHSALLRAEALYLRGRLQLARDDPRAALEPLRGALRLRLELQTPMAAARARVHLAAACLALGDSDGAELERAAAREVFEAAGCQEELAALRAADAVRTPLSEREVEVVYKVAAGLSNRAVARQLNISEKTVASHLGHIFTKLGVTNRAGVTAYYYEELAGHR